MRIENPLRAKNSTTGSGFLADLGKTLSTNAREKTDQTTKQSSLNIPRNPRESKSAPDILNAIPPRAILKNAAIERK
jgi:hypothetical protein